ncbi:hypothetical protein L0F63_005787 [Massospora cicadina]|nr:hypothetical protein L0F63_005787 [Massospora cicadina]
MFPLRGKLLNMRDASPVQVKENNVSAYNVKYYKGLATSDQREGDDERQIIDLTFSKKKVNAHKEWLSQLCPGTYIDQSDDMLLFNYLENEDMKVKLSDLYTKFNLMDSISTSNLMCFDKNCRIKHYTLAEEILIKLHNI